MPGTRSAARDILVVRSALFTKNIHSNGERRGWNRKQTSMTALSFLGRHTKCIENTEHLTMREHDLLRDLKSI